MTFACAGVTLACVSVARCPSCPIPPSLFCQGCSPWNLHIIDKGEEKTTFWGIPHPQILNVNVYNPAGGELKRLASGQQWLPVNDCYTCESGGETFNNTYSVPAASRQLGHPGLNCIMGLYFAAVICFADSGT